LAVLAGKVLIKTVAQRPRANEGEREEERVHPGIPSGQAAGLRDR